jgi:hypothetical protein
MPAPISGFIRSDDVSLLTIMSLIRQTPTAGSILAGSRLHTVQIGNRVVCPVEQVIIKAMQRDPAKRFRMQKYACCLAALLAK